MKNYREQFYSKTELQKIEGDLITLPELQKVLKKKSASSIAHLILSKKIKVQKILGKTYTTKLDLFHFFYPELLQEAPKNKDWEVDKDYKEFLGIENKVIPAKTIDKKSGKQVLEDNKVITKNKPNRDTLKLKVKQ